jgi:hypothetical protein
MFCPAVRSVTLACASDLERGAPGGWQGENARERNRETVGQDANRRSAGGVTTAVYSQTLARPLPPGRGLSQKKRRWQRGVPFRWEAYSPGKACRNGGAPKTDERYCASSGADATLFWGPVMGRRHPVSDCGLDFGFCIGPALAVFPGKPGIPRASIGGPGVLPSLRFGAAPPRDAGAAIQNTRLPRRGHKAQGDNSVMGERSGHLEGHGRCEERALPCPTDAPAQRGPMAQGGSSGGVAPATRMGGGARLRGERGVTAVSSAAPLEPPRCCPLRFPPLGVFEFEGGIRKGGFQGGKTDGGKQRCRGRPPRSSSRGWRAI